MTSTEPTALTATFKAAQRCARGGGLVAAEAPAAIARERGDDASKPNGTVRYLACSAIVLCVSMRFAVDSSSGSSHIAHSVYTNGSMSWK